MLRERESDMRFADFHEGMTADIGPATLTEQEIIEFARHYDPQWFHTDPDRAASGWHGGLIASGWHTASLMMRLLATKFLSPASSLGSPGIDELRWLAPVRGYRLVRRRELLPDEPTHPRAEDRYYRVDVGPLAPLLLVQGLHPPPYHLEDHQMNLNADWKKSSRLA